MYVRILREHCCGNGQCVEIAPDVFVLDSKQKSTVVDAEGAPIEKIIEAARACPCDAILVEDEEGHRVAP
jgi:ferredoxin